MEGAGRMMAQQDHGPHRQGRPLTPGAVETLVPGAVVVTEAVMEEAAEAETLAVVTVEWDTQFAMLIPTEESKSFLLTF